MNSPVEHSDSRQGAKHSDGFLYSNPPRVEPWVSADLIDSYRRAARFDPSIERIKALSVDAGTFLDEIRRLSPNDPEGKDFKSIARGLALERTKADTQKGEAIDLWGSKHRPAIINSYVENILYMQLLTHPAVLEARLAMIKNPIGGRVQRLEHTFEDAIDRHIGISWKNIGWGINERLTNQADPGDESTTQVRAQGMWSFLCPDKNNPLVALPIVGPSHPDLVSALSLADLAICGCVVFAPCDAQYSGKRNGLAAQKELIKTAYYLIENHPLIHNHPFGDHRLSNGETVRQHLIKEAKARIGSTLKPFPTEESALWAKELNSMGVTVFRIFDPRDTLTLPHTIEAVMKAAPNATVFASQITGVNSANSCRDAGARAFIMNIGDGGHCKTASGTGMVPSNPIAFYRVQRDVAPDMGIILDGGVGETWVLGMALGATGTMKHGSLVGSTIQQAPCFVGIKGSDGRIFKLQSGEAADRTKYRSGDQVDVAGNPKNEEGVDHHVEMFAPDIRSNCIGRLDLNFLTPAAKQLAFCGANSLTSFMLWSNPVVWSPTGEATFMAAPHVR